MKKNNRDKNTSYLAQKRAPVLRPKPHEPSARERIVATAARLFESQGYAATGINQIIAESGTAKASFYDHFASKELLGEEYLERYGRHHLTLIRQLTERAQNPEQFIAAWVRLIERQLREKKLYGCPMANMRAQIGADSPRLIRKVRELTQDTIALIADYLVSRGIAADNRHALIAARRVFAAYEGAIHIWQLTGEAEALGDIEVMAMRVMECKHI